MDDVLYSKDKVIDEVLHRFVDRADEGMVKYGVSMAENDGDLLYWLNHSIEEAMDLVNYLTKIKQLLEANEHLKPDAPTSIPDDKQLNLKI